MFGLLGAYATSTRLAPAAGIPVAACHVAPAFVEYSTLPAHPPAIALFPFDGSKSMSWTTSPESTCVQPVPPSSVRKIPAQVAASCTLAFPGATARRFVYHQFEFAVDASCDQLVPPFVLLKTPAPRLPSPVPLLPTVFS